MYLGIGGVFSRSAGLGRGQFVTGQSAYGSGLETGEINLNSRQKGKENYRGGIIRIMASGGRRAEEGAALSAERAMVMRERDTGGGLLARIHRDKRSRRWRLRPLDPASTVRAKRDLATCETETCPPSSFLPILPLSIPLNATYYTHVS